MSEEQQVRKSLPKCYEKAVGYIHEVPTGLSKIRPIDAFIGKHSNVKFTSMKFRVEENFSSRTGAPRFYWRRIA